MCPLLQGCVEGRKRGGQARRQSAARWRRTFFATASRLICWKPAPTCAPFSIARPCQDRRYPHSNLHLSRRHLAGGCQSTEAIEVSRPDEVKRSRRRSSDEPAHPRGGRHRPRSGQQILGEEQVTPCVDASQVCDAIVRCRTAALGGHLDQCIRCGHQAISYNSCDHGTARSARETRVPSGWPRRSLSYCPCPTPYRLHAAA